MDNFNQQTGKIIFKVVVVIAVLLFLAILVKVAKKPEIFKEIPSEVYKPPIAKEYGAGDHEFTINHDGLTRTYKVHVPQNYNRNIKTPVVIYLHGGGGSKEAAYKDGIDKYSDKYGFILAVPEGTGPTVPGKIIGSWNAGEWEVKGKIEKCCSYASENNIDDVGFLSKMIDDVKNKFNVDEKRVYSTGISNGGMMSYTLACKIADKVAAVAPVASPGTPRECSPSGSVSVMHIHGTADPCAPYNGGMSAGCLGTEPREMQSAEFMINRWINLNSCQQQNYETAYKNGKASCINYKACKANSNVQFCTIKGMGHTYPSGNQYLPVSRIGPVSYDISFDQIWEFFKKHSLGGGISTKEPGQKPVPVCGDNICSTNESESSCPSDCDASLCSELYDYYENECIKKGWQKTTIDVNGITRKILWNAPSGGWQNGAIIVLHGGGGTYSNTCSNIKLGEPMVNFSDLALKEGFAVFSLESTYNRAIDIYGNPIGKRWDCVSKGEENDKDNIDLMFIEKVITKIIPELRPKNSAESIFMTGISNGGFTTILAATHFSDKLTAFAPVAAGDPYGTYLDMSTLLDNERKCAPGVFRDSQTNIKVNEDNACDATSYPNEKKWPVVSKKIPFKQFHHKGDGAADISCMRKAQKMLVEHGYKDEGPFIIENIGFKSSLKHFWNEKFNKPMIDFFKKYSQISTSPCPDIKICDDSKRMSLVWVDIVGTSFPDQGLIKEQTWDVVKVGSYIYSSGNIWGGEDNADVVLRKYTEDNQLVWEKKWDNGPTDAGFVIVSDGSYLYVGGFTHVKVSGIYRNQALLQKYDLDGNLIWTKTWGDKIGGHHEIDGLAIVGNDLYVSHWDATWGILKSQAVVKKINKSDGSIIWSKIYGSSDKVSTTDGHIYADETGVWVAGRLNSEGPIKGGDAYLTKIDSNGNQLWIKTFGDDGVGDDGYDNALSLKSDGQHIYLTGMTQRPGKEFDAIFAKFDKNGNKIWEKIIGGDKNEFSRGVAVDNKYVYVAYVTESWGNGETDTILAKYDKSTGEVIDFSYWGEGTGYDGASASLILDRDYVYMAGRSSSYGKNSDGILVKARR